MTQAPQDAPLTAELFAEPLRGDYALAYGAIAFCCSAVLVK